MSNNQKLTVKEAADYLGIAVPAVYGLLKRGVLRTIKESPRKTFIPIEDLDNYKNGVETVRKDPETSENSDQEVSNDIQKDPEITFKIGDKLRISNIENRKKLIWGIQGEKFEPAQVDSEFVGIIDNIIQHDGREFVYLTLDKGTSRWCILGEQVRGGLFTFVEPSEKPSEEVSNDVVEEDEEEPTEKLVEVMKSSGEVSNNVVEEEEEEPVELTEKQKELSKIVEDDDRIWKLVQEFDEDLKTYIKENGKGTENSGYTLYLGKREITYQPGCKMPQFNWDVAMEFFLTNRYLIWKLLKEHNVVTKQFIDKVEMQINIPEEIKIK
jgi:excisionase family DNA binding protein